MADPDAEWWTMADIAEHWGVEPGTIQDYRNQTRHPRRPGQAAKLPPEDDKFGRTPVWRPGTILGFKRPGRGRGGGRKSRGQEPGQPGSSPGDGAPRRRDFPEASLPGSAPGDAAGVLLIPASADDGAGGSPGHHQLCLRHSVKGA